MSLPQPPGPTAEDLMAGLARVLAATYQGRDPAALVTATVDGDGLVVDVTLAPSVVRYDTRAVEEAIRLAVAAAQRSIADAFAALTTPPPASEAAGSIVVDDLPTTQRSEEEGR